ncbi:MAG: hypothetical protein ACRCW2_09965 [Cellulosilyticaceae bacterium]
MFGNFRRKKKNIEASEAKAQVNQVTAQELIQIKQLLASKKLPIVVLDSMWYEIRGVLSHIDVSGQENELKELLKEQGKLTTDLKEYSVVKQNLLQQVLVISQEVNEKGNTSKLEELDKTSQAILKLNETIEAQEKRALEVGDAIEKINHELIEKVVIDAYGSMEGYKVQKNTLEVEIDRLRKAVVEKTEEKKKCDESINGIYNYLHKMIGYQYLDKMDRKLGE